MKWMAFVVILSFSSTGDDEAVRAIVEKAVRAHGGPESLLRAFRWKERYFIGDSKEGTLRDAVLQPPDSWWQGNTNIAERNADRSEKTYLVWAWTLVPLLEKDSRLSLLPEALVDGRPAAGL